jgi:hypothetical protein
MTTVCWVHKVELLAAFTDRGETVTDKHYFRIPYDVTTRHLKQKRLGCCSKVLSVCTITPGPIQPNSLTARRLCTTLPTVPIYFPVISIPLDIFKRPFGWQVISRNSESPSVVLAVHRPRRHVLLGQVWPGCVNQKQIRANESLNILVSLILHNV